MFRDDPGERLSFFRPDALPGVEIMASEHSTQPWHVYHERYDICACRAANAGYTYRGKRARFTDRSVAFLEPGEVHKNTDVQKPADFKVLLIDPGVFQSAADHMGAVLPHYRLEPSEDPILFEAFYRFCQSVEEGATALEQQSRFAACMRLFFSFAEAPPRRAISQASEAVRRARNYILDRYSENVTLPELEAVARVSRYHLVRAFARQYGVPPHAFQIHVRVERATALLRAGFQPVEVASVVGFADQSHLNRHFKRIWRTTPSGYARTHARL